MYVCMCACVYCTYHTRTHNNARSLSLPLSLSLVLSLSLPLSLFLSLSHKYTHTPQAVRLDPQNASALFNRGSALDSLGIFVYACVRARAHTHTHHLLVPISISIRLHFIQTDQTCSTLQDNSTTPSPTSPRRWSSTWQARARSRENPDSTSTHSGAEISGPRQITGRPVDSVKVGDYRGCHDQGRLLSWTGIEKCRHHQRIVKVGDYRGDEG